MDTIPDEVLLDILSAVPYHPSTRATLRLVSHRFKSMLDTYEHSLVRTITAAQFPWARRQFPSLLSEGRKPAMGWNSLATVFYRTAVLSNIKSRCVVIRQRGGTSQHSAWTTGRALTFHHAGLLALYRVSDCETPEAKAELLRSMPKATLAVLTFTLMMSIHLLRALGPEMLLYWTTPITDESRSEIELACEEVLLHRGPEFLLGMLQHRSSSANALKDEYYSMDSRQSPAADGTIAPPTLIATLRQTFSKLADCEMQYNLVHMWYVLDEECGELAGMDDEKVRDAVERVVNGEAMDKSNRLIHMI